MTPRIYNLTNIIKYDTRHDNYAFDVLELQHIDSQIFFLLYGTVISSIALILEFNASLLSNYLNFNKRAPKHPLHKPNYISIRRKTQQNKILISRARIKSKLNLISQISYIDYTDKAFVPYIRTSQQSLKCRNSLYH